MKVKILFGLLVVVGVVLMFRGNHHISSMYTVRVGILTKENAIQTPENSSVMIHAYMRSGSTFISSLLSYRNDTFLWYEPLWNLQPWGYYDNEKRVCNSSVPSCKPVTSDHPRSAHNALQLLRDIYSCSIEQHMDKFKDNLMGLKRDEAYKKCRKNGFPIRKCYPVFARKCESSKHIVTKVLRLNVQLTEPLLENFLNLKVLKLLRDPRGIINSRINTRWYPIFDKPGSLRSVEKDVKVLCGRMRRDIEGAELLIRKFPKRFKIIQYEDAVGLTDKPAAIYQFVGMDPSATDIRLVDLLEKNKNYRPDTYRTKMGKNTLEIVQKHCGDVIEMLGLRMFTSYEEMADLNVSVIRKPLPYRL